MRKWSLFLLALAFAVVLTACSDSSGGKDTSDIDSNGSTSDNNSNEQMPVISFGLSTGGNQYVEASQDINKDEHIEKLRTLSGIDVQLELIPWTDYEQNITLLFAGGDYPDLLQTQGITMPEVAPAVEANVFMPLNDLLEEHAPNLMASIPQEAWNSPKVSKDGEIYAIPSLSFPMNEDVVFMRKDWLDALELEVPTTVDEYMEVLRAFRDRDPNGNNLRDEIPFSARENFRFGESFFGAFDVPIGSWRYVDGELLPNFIRPEMKEALAVYRELYQEKLLDNEFLVQQGKDWDAKIKGQAIVGMWQHAPTYPDRWLTQVRESEPNAEIVIAPAPVGPGGHSGAPIGSDPVGGMVYMIPNSSKDPVAAIKFMDWFYTEEAQRFITYGIEGTDYTMENGKIQFEHPVTLEQSTRQLMRHYWLRFIGPDPIGNEEFMSSKPEGKLVLDSLKVANNEGVIDDGDGIPVLPTQQARPELGRNGLFLETAAKIMTGEEELEVFDKFVEDWRARGGEQWIEEATEWYHNK